MGGIFVPILQISRIDTSPFTLFQQELMHVVIICGSCLSIIGGLFIGISYLWYANLRSFPYKLIVILSLCEIGSCVAYIMGINLDLCYAQGIMSEFFNVSTVLWTGCFGVNIYQVLVRGNSKVHTWELAYHLFVWGLATLLTSINVYLDSFKPGIMWCWIGQDFVALRFLTFYGPLIATMVCNAVLYLIIARTLAVKANIQEQVNSRLTQYITVFVFVHIWGLINRAQNWMYPDKPMFILYLMHAIFSPLQGFLNSCVYGINKQVRDHYYQICFDKPDEFEVENFSSSCSVYKIERNDLSKVLKWDIPYTDVPDFQLPHPNLKKHECLSNNKSTKRVHYKSQPPIDRPTNQNLPWILEGYLLHKEESNRAFQQKLYFAIEENSLLFSQSPNLINAIPIPLTNSIVRIPDDNGAAFQLETSDRIFFLQASNNMDRRKWTNALKLATEACQKTSLSSEPNSPTLYPQPRSYSHSYSRCHSIPTLNLNPSPTRRQPRWIKSNSRAINEISCPRLSASI